MSKFKKSQNLYKEKWEHNVLFTRLVAFFVKTMLFSISVMSVARVLSKELRYTFFFIYKNPFYM